MTQKNAPIAVKNLTMAYGSRIIQQDISFEVPRGEICIIMGGSGCGKSTLMRHMVGLKEPCKGDVFIHGESLWQADEEQQAELLRKIGVMYQGGALWSAMTLAENIELPLQRYTNLSENQCREMAEFKLALVGLSGFEDYYPSEISGGMQKRASIARAMALDPEIIFFDEPSAGLDPISSRQLDELILQLRDSLNMTFIVITHELPSIFAIGTHGIFLDAERKTKIAEGSPRYMLEHSNEPKVIEFLSRGEQSHEKEK